MRAIRLQRRTFLRGLVGGLALPPLEAMMDGRGLLYGPAWAAGAAKPPVRFVGFWFMNGPPTQLFNPKQTGADYELPPALQPLAKWRADFNVITNLHQDYTRDGGHPGGDHGNGEFGATTGVPGVSDKGGGGPSYEYILGNALGKETPLPALSLALPRRGTLDINNGVNNASWLARLQKAPVLDTPRKIFDKVTPKMPGATTADPAAAIRARREKSLLDFVRADAQRLSGKLGAGDKARLDQHLESLRDIEKQVNGIDRNAAAACGLPPGEAPVDARPADQPHYQDVMRLTAKLVAYVFRCDVSRYVMLNVSNPEILPGTAKVAPDPDHHTSHFETNNAAHLWFAQEKHRYIGMLMEELKAAKEGDRDVLYNSLITTFWGVGQGNKHWHAELPVILAGNAGGQVKTGRHLRAPGAPGGCPGGRRCFDGGTPMNNVMASIFNYCGLKMDKFGADGTGLFPGLDT